MLTITLTPSNRTFFALVADAAYTNPFSEKRLHLDRQIAGLAGQADQFQNWLQVVPVVLEKLRFKLTELQQACDVEQLTLQHFSAADRELMKYVFLFDIFHQFSLNFDALIARQEKSPEKSVVVAFAPKAMAALVNRGFETPLAARYMALFYQIRRAYYFIHQGLVGPSDCMQKLRMDLWNNIFTHDIRDYEQYLWDRMEDFATILEGPTGSGKGAAAAAIGKSGFIPFDPNSSTFQSSFMELFVPANLSQYAPGLLESELFGHTRGAFTGAVTEHDGLFGMCRPHGTIFLDEIGEVAAQVQVKLLKVLEERTFTPVGSYKIRRFFGRVIAATNRPVSELRQTGAFREDFYYRLCADCIEVPSLSQRVKQNPAELVELVNYFTHQITGVNAPELSAKAMEVIESRLGRDYPWPGNVRELAQCIRRVILKQDYQPLTNPPKNRITQIAEAIQKGQYTADELTSQYCKILYEKNNSYQEVAKTTALDWRTAKKKIQL